MPTVPIRPQRRVRAAAKKHGTKSASIGYLEELVPSARPCARLLARANAPSSVLALVKKQHEPAFAGKSLPKSADR